MAEDLANAYDEVSYAGFPFPQTHPDRLATIATLLGIEPAPVESCRVLELGCGDGGNIVPMAYGLPGSRFVGIDLAALPISRGRAMAEALGLKNVALYQEDILQFSVCRGEFDYIIAHGIYSWVPTCVQDKLLEICHSNLAPHGVAYVSYNTLPGWHLRNMVREMMLFHARRLSNPSERISQGLALIKFLSESKTEPDLYQDLLRQELERLMQRGEASLYHDELARTNFPVYLFQFVEHAARHGLQYLSEANFFEVQKWVFPATVAKELERLGDNVIEREQYLDFLKCRKFRQTLLCHQDIAIDRAPKPEDLTVFHVAAALSPPTTVCDLNSVREEEFRTPKGTSITVSQPIIKAALLHLSEIWPQSAHFSDLRRVALSRLEKNRPEENEATVILGRVLLEAYGAGVVELHRRASDWAVKVSERPVASPLVRLQIRSQTSVTNLRHVAIQVDGALERQLLTLLDGTRNRAALLSELRELLESSLASMEPNSEILNKTRHALENLSVDLEPNLQQLARLALLVA